MISNKDLVLDNLELIENNINNNNNNSTHANFCVKFENVNKVVSAIKKRNKNKRVCYNCRKPGHLAAECCYPYKDKNVKRVRVRKNPYEKMMSKIEKAVRDYINAIQPMKKYFDLEEKYFKLQKKVEELELENCRLAIKVHIKEAVNPSKPELKNKQKEQMSNIKQQLLTLNLQQPEQQLPNKEEEEDLKEEEIKEEETIIQDDDNSIQEVPKEKILNIPDHQVDQAKEGKVDNFFRTVEAFGASCSNKKLEELDDKQKQFFEKFAKFMNKIGVKPPDETPIEEEQDEEENIPPVPKSLKFNENGEPVDSDDEKEEQEPIDQQQETESLNELCAKYFKKDCR